MDLNNVGGTLITLLTIGVIAYVSISLFNSISTTSGFDVSSSTIATLAKSNFTAGIWSSVQLMSNVPYLIGALCLLGVVMAFGYYASSGKMA
jgi:hypothetical protein